MEKKIANMETNIATMQKPGKNIEIKIANVDKNMANIEEKMVTIETKIEKSNADVTTDIEAKFGTVNNEVKELKTTLVVSLDQVNDVLGRMEDKIKENTRIIRNTPSGHMGKIFVADYDSVEIFSWSHKSWANLQSMPEERLAATAFVHDNHVVIAGGHSYDSGYLDDLTTHWSECPVKLPAKLAYHNSVVYNDHLYVSGGFIDGLDQVSDRIHDVLLFPPYTVKTLSRMPEPREGHGMEILDNTLLIVGGSTTNNYEDNLSSVVMYDIQKQECK